MRFADGKKPIVVFNQTLFVMQSITLLEGDNVMNRDLFKCSSRRQKLARSVTLTATSMVLLFGLLLLQGGPGLAFAGDNSLLKAEAEIQKLAVGYALGTDAIGSGNLEEGKEIYSGVFVEDVVVEIIFMGFPGGEVVGRDAWAEFTFASYDGVYAATQHHIGSINVEVHGSSATMSSYVIATLVKLDGSGSVVVKGTYYDDVERDSGQWRIAHRTFSIISFMP